MLILFYKKFVFCIYKISKLTFILKKYFVLSFSDSINILIYYLCSIIISYVIGYVFNKLKLFKNYLFLVKE